MMMLLNIGADLYYWQTVINHVTLDAICSLADVYPMFPLLTSLQYVTCAMDDQYFSENINAPLCIFVI